VIDSLTPWEQVAFFAALAVIVVNLVWTIWLFRRARGPAGQVDEGEATTDDFTWVFFVPALNEEVTIADSVTRLLDVSCRDRHIVVIDDASDDRTPDVLAALDAPGLVVVRRELPDARVGKASALNDAWRRLPSLLGDVDSERTIVCIVDADGRLDADAPSKVVDHFADPGVGGVQVRVRIYNRQRMLTRAQDIEFGVYGLLYQAARSTVGTAGMGGNGQFNRLAALNDVADEEGPWRHKLTEDQDIGLRMLEAGWRCGHDNRASVEQQGLSNLRRLLRQRTRWSQGNLQAMVHLGSVPGYQLTRRARLDQAWYLLQPVASAVVGVGVLAALVASITRGVELLPEAWMWLAAALVLAFGGVVLGVTARTGRDPQAWLIAVTIGIAYSFYAWLLWPALMRATWRQLRAKGAWAKTEREAITGAPALAAAVQMVQPVLRPISSPLPSTPSRSPSRPANRPTRRPPTESCGNRYRSRGRERDAIRKIGAEPTIPVHQVLWDVIAELPLNERAAAVLRFYGGSLRPALAAQSTLRRVP